MEGAHPFVIDVQEGKVIHLLQDHVAGVVQNVGALVATDHPEEALEGCAVVQIFAGVQFVADIDAGLVEGIQNRQPAPAQFLKSLIDQPRRPLRPGIEERPRQRARKSRVRIQAQVAAGFGRKKQLVRRPRLAGFHVACQLRRRKAFQQCVEGRVAGHQLPLQVRGKLGDRKPGITHHAANFIAVGLAFGGQFQIEQAPILGRNLHPGKSQARRPLRHSLERVEGRRILCKLRQKNSRSFDRLHRFSPAKFRTFKTSPSFQCGCSRSRAQ